MRVKSVAESILRKVPPLFRVSSKAYHYLRYSAHPLSPGASEAIAQAFWRAKELHGEDIGDYYEFGVFRGSTFLRAYEVCRNFDLSRTRLYGFDSFQGLPVVDGLEAGDPRFFKGQFTCPKSVVVQHLTKCGLDWSRAELIEGFYAEVLTAELHTQFPFRPAGVVLFDCDLYSSTRDALQWLAPLMTDNTIVLFDDWYAYGKDARRGQPRAFTEFLAHHPRLKAEPLWEFPHHGKAFHLRAAYRLPWEGETGTVYSDRTRPRGSDYDA